MNKKTRFVAFLLTLVMCFGIVPFTLKNEDDYDKIAELDKIMIEGFAEAVGSADGAILKDTSKGIEIPLVLNLTDRQRKILLSGGMLQYTKQNQ